MGCLIGEEVRNELPSEISLPRDDSVVSTRVQPAVIGMIALPIVIKIRRIRFKITAVKNYT